MVVLEDENVFVAIHKISHVVEPEFLDAIHSGHNEQLELQSETSTRTPSMCRHCKSWFQGAPDTLIQGASAPLNITMSPQSLYLANQRSPSSPSPSVSSCHNSSARRLLSSFNVS